LTKDHPNEFFGLIPVSYLSGKEGKVGRYLKIALLLAALTAVALLLGESPWNSL
jgi:hypothetical protein